MLDTAEKGSEAREISIAFDTNSLPDGDTEIFIRICDCEDNCTDSQVVTYVVDNTISNPDTVSIISTNYLDNNFNIEWGKSSAGDFDNYQLFHSLDSQMTSANQIYYSNDIDEVSYLFDSPNPYAFNYFHIVVTDTFGYSSTSEVKSGILLADPVTVSVNTGATFADIIAINWTQTADTYFLKYNLYIASDSSMLDKSIIFSSDNISNLSFNSIDNNYNETYFFQVGSINQWNLEILSNIISISPEYVTFINDYDDIGSDELGIFGIQNSQDGYSILGSNANGILLLTDYVTGINQSIKDFEYGSSEVGIKLIKSTEDELVIVSNVITDNQDNNARITKISNSGDIQWSTIYGSGGGTPSDNGNVGIDISRDLEATLDGGFVSTGTFNWNIGRASDLWILKTNSDGDVELNTYLTISGESTNEDTHGSAVCETPSGFIFVGYIEDLANFSSKNIWLVKWDYNESDSIGDTVWTKEINIEDYDTPTDIMLTSFNEVISIGYSTSTADGESDGSWILKSDLNGQVSLLESFSGNNQLHSIIETDNSNFILVGKKTVNSDSQAWVVCVDTFGNTLWERTFGSENEDTFKSVVQTSDGGFFLTGTSDIDTGNANILRVKTDPLGNVID